MLNDFQGLSKLQKNYVEKIKGSPPYLTCNSIEKISNFFISMLKFVAIAVFNKADRPTSKKYVTAQCNLF